MKTDISSTSIPNTLYTLKIPKAGKITTQAHTYKKKNASNALQLFPQGGVKLMVWILLQHATINRVHVAIFHQEREISSQDFSQVGHADGLGVM